MPRASRNLGTCFFLHLMTIVRLTFRAPQIVVRARVYANVFLAVHILQRQKYFRVEGKLQFYSNHHQPWTQSAYPDYFLLRKKQQMGLLPIQNQTTRQLSFNCVLKQRTQSVYLSVCWFKTARLLANISIRSSRLCNNGGFAQITQTPSNTHIKAEMFKIFHY